MTGAASATDVAVTATNRANVTGAQIATDLEDAVQAVGGLGATTVKFRTSGGNLWKFAFDTTVNDPPGTDVIIEAPEREDLTDATKVLFNKTGSSGTAYWVSNLPQDTFVETDLPAGFLTATDVEWDGQRLTEAPWEMFISPETRGDPIYYATKNKKIRLFPVPSEQKMFQVWYKGTETDLAVNGSADSTECPLPSEAHMAPTFYATAMLLGEKHEYEKVNRHMGSFFRMAREYRLRESNADWSLFPDTETVYRPPRVISST